MPQNNEDLIKRLLKKHKYPPDGMDDAVQTVMAQCEFWGGDNSDMGEPAGTDSGTHQ